MLIRYFSSKTFKTRLWDAIAEIEGHSLVEIVVMIKPQSEYYTDISLWCGALFSFLSYTFFMFSHWVFGDYLIYTGTIGAFALGVVLSNSMPTLQRFLLSKARKKRHVEIMARALFQKAGIYNTYNHTGVFIYLSLFERLAYVLPDTTAQTALPFDEWQQLQQELNDIFNTANPAEALLQVLAKQKERFSHYLPPVENDINELPDNLEVDL